jgi:hypothetical protein
MTTKTTRDGFNDGWDYGMRTAGNANQCRTASHHARLRAGISSSPVTRAYWLGVARVLRLAIRK